MISLILVGCQSEPETLGIIEVDQITAELERVIEPGLELQTAYDGDNRYIVLHTTGKVTASVVGIDNIASVQFDIDEEQDGQINQYVYILTLDPEQDTIDVSINGERTHFDLSTGF